MRKQVLQECLLPAADEKALDIIHHTAEPSVFAREGFPFVTRLLQWLLQLSQPVRDISKRRGYMIDALVDFQSLAGFPDGLETAPQYIEHVKGILLQGCGILQSSAKRLYGSMMLFHPDVTQADL